jgi:hypothetical protein
MREEWLVIASQSVTVSLVFGLAMLVAACLPSQCDYPWCQPFPEDRSWPEPCDACPDQVDQETDD